MLLFVLFWRENRLVIHKIKGRGLAPNGCADRSRRVSAGAELVVRRWFRWFLRGSRRFFPPPPFRRRSLFLRSRGARREVHGDALRSALVRFLAREPRNRLGRHRRRPRGVWPKKKPRPGKKPRPDGLSPKHKGPLAVRAPLDDSLTLTRALALDCEMVGVGPDGEKSVLAQVSVVNESRNVVFESCTRRRTKKVTDYRTHVSGITPKHVADAPSFATVRDAVKRLLEGHVVVGHALENDFDALQLKHPPELVRDTAHWRPFYGRGASRSGCGTSRDHCGLKIQAGRTTPPRTRARRCTCTSKYKENWEGQVWATRQGRDGRGRIYHY